MPKSKKFRSEPSADPGFWIESISQEPGETVRVVLCGNWSSPVDLISASRKICQAALAR